MKLPSIHGLRNKLIGNAYARRLQERLVRPFMRPPAAPATFEEGLRMLVDRQLAPWRGARLDRATLAAAFRSLNEERPFLHVFEVKDQAVSVWRKPGEGQQSGPPNAVLSSRVQYYLWLLSAALLRGRTDADMLLAVDLDDMARESVDVPVFAFQKPHTSRNILLPDVDFPVWGWYALINDARPYEDKQVRACFVGSSTGAVITARTVFDGTVPRLRAATYFLDSPTVDFRIATAAQCDSPATEALLRGQRYFSHQMGWAEQFSYRFLVSIDGNGAACSRPLIALKSNSVLVKYRSPFGLYYFPALVAGRDYIEVSTDREVEEVVEAEQREPGRFKQVAEAGKAFASRYLNQASVLDYTAALLKNYARIYRR